MKQTSGSVDLAVDEDDTGLSRRVGDLLLVKGLSRLLPVMKSLQVLFISTQVKIKQKKHGN